MVAAALEWIGVSASTAATVSSVVSTVATAVSVVSTIASIGASAAGAVAAPAAAAIAVKGDIVQAQTDNTNFTAQQQIFYGNEAIQKDNATRVSQEFVQKENLLRRQRAMFLGRQRASLAQSGIGLGSGSALDVEQDSIVNSELDALTVRYEGASQRLAYLQDADVQRFSGDVAGYNAKQSLTAGGLKAAGDALTGVTNTAKAWSGLSVPSFSSSPSAGSAWLSNNDASVRGQSTNQFA